MRYNSIKLSKKIARDIYNINLNKESYSHWPCSFKSFSEICFNEFSYILEKSFENITNNNIKKISKNLIYPSIIAQYFYFFIGLRKTIEDTKRKKISKNLFKIIEKLRQDPLCKYGKNKLQKIKIPSFNNAKKVETSLLNFLLQTYLEFIYLLFMPLAREFHGPYNLKNGNYLIIKEYHNLSSTYIKENLPRNISIYEIYNKNTPKFDFFNHLLNNNERPIYCYAKMNNIFVEEKEIEEFNSKIKIYLNELVNIPEEKLVKEAILKLFYSFENISPKEDYTKIIKEISQKRINLSKDDNPQLRTYSELYKLFKEALTDKKEYK